MGIAGDLDAISNHLRNFARDRSRSGVELDLEIKVTLPGPIFDRALVELQREIPLVTDPEMQARIGLWNDRVWFLFGGVRYEKGAGNDEYSRRAAAFLR